MCGGYPKSKSGNPNWNFWARKDLTDEQREILRDKGVEIMFEGMPSAMVVAANEETVQWLRSLDWVARIDRETSQDWMESLDTPE